MEKKVVVMSGADVAEMRKAHKEAEKAYYQAKVGALEFIAEEMRSTNKEYTIYEIAHMTGLTPGEIVAQFNLTNIDCKAAREAGLRRNEVQSERRYSERQFVEVLPTGEINPNNVMTVRRSETVLRIPPRRK